MSLPRRLAGWCALSAFVVALAVGRLGYSQQVTAKQEARAAAKEAMAEESGGGPNPLAVDPDLAIWTGVVFVLLFLVLRTFAWPQITAALTERENRIANSIAEADARLADAKRIMAEHEAKLAATAGEVRAMLEEARRDADQTRRQIEADGHKAAKDELDRAVREIGRARDAAIQELAISSANVAVDLARDVVREQISSDRQQQIVRDALGKLGTANPSTN